MCHRWINEVTSSSDIVLYTSISDVLQVVIMATHVGSNVVFLQKRLESLNEDVCWTMFSDGPDCVSG